MDFLIKEYASKNSDRFILSVGVDEERTIYQFDEFSLERFVNAVFNRASELLDQKV